MITIASFGVLFGLGLFLALRGVRRQKPTLSVLVTRLFDGMETPRVRPLSSRTMPFMCAVDDRFGPRFARCIPNARDKGSLLVRDLRMAGMSLEQYAVDKFMLAGIGAVLGLLIVSFLAVLPLPIPTSVLVAVAPGFGGLAFLLPNLLLKNEVQKFRTEFRAGLSSLLELVAIGMAGGAQVHSALSHAVLAGRPRFEMHNSRGRGWVFEELGRPLDEAARERRPPWEHLRKLGRDFGVPELSELTSSVLAAGIDGAHVRNSLMSRAKSLRSRRISEAEAEAGETSEKMAFPIAMLAIGFLLLIGFPAVMRVFNSFGG